AGGQTGVDRALELFIFPDVELALATLPDGLDPCDLLARPDRLDLFPPCLADATHALNFKLHQLLAQPEANSVEGSRRVVDAVLGVMALAPDIPNHAAQLKQQLIVTRLAQRVGVRQESVWARLRELRSDRQRAEKRGPGRPTTDADL